MKRRQFINHLLRLLLLLSHSKKVMSYTSGQTDNTSKFISLFLCGDVMTGRGIDQILPHPGKPQLHEPYVQNARRYVELAEQISGAIPRPVSFSYIWGDALKALEKVSPDLRIINLETSITSSDKYWRGKGIHYRMHPGNISCLTRVAIDCCVLANNHILDWGYPGLTETLQTLHDAKIKTAGAGQDTREANAPAILEVKNKGRVIVFSFGMPSSGVEWQMAAMTNRPGVNLLADLSSKTIRQIHAQVQAVRREGDIVLVSIHWGGNWGYNIPREHIRFAHQLIDTATVDVIHGHSSHHAKGIEVYKGKPIIYGCGDFLNDYEGITGYEAYRDDLVLMYLLGIEPSNGKLVSFEMVPFQIRRFRLNQATEQDVIWLQDMLNREGKRFNCRVKLSRGFTLSLEW